MAASTMTQNGLTVERKASRMPERCPGCDNPTGWKLTSQTQVFVCSHCEGLVGTCYQGDSFALVRPVFSRTTCPPAVQRYFDLTVLGSDGVSRRHGWYNPQTRTVEQVG